MKILRDITTFLSESERETNKAIKALMDHWSKEDDESLLKVQRHIVKASTAMGNADKKVYSRIRWLDAERPGWRAEFERQYRAASVQEKKAFMDATPEHREVVRYHLCEVLSCLRAQYLSYQTSHWQVVGGSFYGNHLLFERLYKTVQEQIDQLAEKIVGYLGRDAVDLTHQMEDIWDFTSAWSQIGCHHRRGLQSEADLQATLKLAYDTITSTGLMTLGLDDWLMATANSHEANQYLLQQALTPVPGKSASGAPTAEGDFYDNPEKKEVLEFAQAGAISNSPEVAAAASKEDHLDVSEAVAVEEAEEAPPTPTEIKEEPGGKTLSTLNRLVVESEDPDAAKAAEDNKARMATWLLEIES